MQINVKRGESPDTADVLTALSNTVFYEDGTPWRASPKQVESLAGVFGVSADRCEERPSDEELDEIARWLAGERRGNAGSSPINGVPEVDYAVIGRSLSWRVSVPRSQVLVLSHPDDPTVEVIIDPLTAVRYEDGDPVDSTDTGDPRTILTWLAAGFHLSMSLAAVRKAKEMAAADFRNDAVPTR